MNASTPFSASYRTTTKIADKINQITRNHLLTVDRECESIENPDPAIRAKIMGNVKRFTKRSHENQEERIPNLIANWQRRVRKRRFQINLNTVDDGIASYANSRQSCKESVTRSPMENAFMAATNRNSCMGIRRFNIRAKYLDQFL